MDNPIRGSTASSALSPPRTDRPRHTLGSVLRAAGVFIDTAFRVVVLGADGTPERSAGGIPRQGGWPTDR